MLTSFLEKLKPAKQKKERLTTAPSYPPPNINQHPTQKNWQPGDTIVERYLVKDIFSGSMGKVYIAQHLGWKIPVAIKSPKPEVIADKEGSKRLYTEANNWVRMGMHPNVATCYYVLNIDEIPHIFIEYVDGGDLSSWLNAGKCKDVRTSLSLAIQFCHGMEFTHSKGIIHRDIKPQNILITKNALLKITDFGIIQTISGNQAHQSFGPLSDADMTEDKTIGFRGTPGFASPEQFQDTHSVDFRTDIYSFGICLWLMFCGRKPFVNNALEERSEPSAPSGSKAPLPDFLRSILKKCVAFNPDERYKTFKDLRTDLNKSYSQIFKVNCPYMELDFSDLQAENFNNRAVSLLELGHVKEGKFCLTKALDMNDCLQEAIYNYILLKWQHSKTPLQHIYRQIETAQKKITDDKLLEALARSVKCQMLGNTWETSGQDETAEESKRPQFFPEYTLCLPKSSLDVFRAGQLHKSTQDNVKDLLEKKKYDSCYNVLVSGWQKINYRRDLVFIDVYEKLLRISEKKSILSIIKLTTIPAGGSIPSPLLYLPKTMKILSLNPAGKIVFRSLTKKKEAKVLEKYQSVVATAASSDGQYLAIGKQDGSITVLSIKNGAELKQVSTNEKITVMAFSPDSKCLTIGSSTGLIYSFSIAKDRKKIGDAKTGGSIKAISYFNDKRDFVVGSSDGSIRTFAKGGKELIHSVKAHNGEVSNISTAANGNFFISHGISNNIKVWDRHTSENTMTIKAHEDTIKSIQILADSNYVVSGGVDDIINIWRLDTGECSQTFDGRGGGICSLINGHKPHIFFSGTKDGAVTAWMVIYDLKVY